jgi:hypothetical protein
MNVILNLKDLKMKKIIDVTLKKYDDFRRLTQDDLGLFDVFLRIFLILSFVVLCINNIAISLKIDRFIIDWSNIISNEEVILFLEYNSGKALIFLLILIGLYYNLIYSIFRKIELHSMYKTYNILEVNRLIDTYDLDNNKILSNKFDELLDKRFNQNNHHSSTMIYDKEGRLGSKFVEIVSDGHWMTTIHDQRNNKFTVEHFRTWENLQNIEWQKRLDEEILLNNETVFGFKDKESDYSRNNESHVFTSNKKP